MRVTGFVPIYAARHGWEHLPGTTLRMSFPGTAEELMTKLEATGYLRAWQAADPGNGEPREYRGAKVFRCYRRVPDVAETAAGAQLIAVWESRA